VKKAHWWCGILALGSGKGPRRFVTVSDALGAQVLVGMPVPAAGLAPAERLVDCW